MRLTGFLFLLAAIAPAAGCMIEKHGWTDEGGVIPDPEQPNPPRTCERDDQCSLGCYCGRDDRHCHASGTCTSDQECPGGFRCDARRSCVPRDGMGGAAGGGGTSGAGSGGAGYGGASGGSGGAIASGGNGGSTDGGAAPDANPPASDAGRPPVTACRIDAQCGPGGRCRNGGCERPCTADSACGTGDVCSAGFCQPSPGGSQCLYSADCAGGGTCINGFCHATCSKDADCPNHADMCSEGHCYPDVRLLPQCTANAYCPAGRMCVDAICRTPCMTDAQCGPSCSGTVCHDGFCVMPEELTPPMCPTVPTCGPPPPGCPSTCR